MLKIIDAEFSPITEPSFRTIKEAIAFGDYINAARMTDDIVGCNGQLITSARWCRERLTLSLANGKRLCFGATMNTVEVAVEELGANDLAYTTHMVSDQTQMDDTLVIRLAGKDIHWHRGETTRSLVGNGIVRMRLIQTGAFLYVATVGVLAVNVLVDPQSGRPFLFWDTS